MFEAYTVGIKVSLIDGVTSPLAFLATKLARTNDEAQKLHGTLLNIKNTFKTGAVLFGTGAVLAAPLVYAIDKAAELQKQMLGIQIATRGTTVQMDSMRRVIEQVSGQTVWSNIDVAAMAKMVATGTGLAAPAVQGLLPAYAKFADVQMLMKGTSYQESTADLIRLAHTAGKYKPEELSAYADTLTKASFIIPGNIGELGHALKYFQGVAKNALGIDDDNAILFVSLLNRLGLSGSRGGTNALAALSRSIPGIFGSGLLTGKSGEALRNMGMVDAAGHSTVFKDGKFDTFLWMGRLAEYVQREMASHPEAIARQDIMKNFQHAFGVQGSRVAALLSSPQAMQQLSAIGAAFAGYGGVDQVQQTFADKSVEQQWMNAKTNFVSVMTELGMTLLPMATAALKRLNTDLQEFTAWITENPGKVKALEYAFVGLSGALMFGGTVMMLKAAFEGLSLALSFASVGGTGGVGGIRAIATAIAGGSELSLVGALAALGVTVVGLAATLNSVKDSGDTDPWEHPGERRVRGAGRGALFTWQRDPTLDQTHFGQHYERHGRIGWWVDDKTGKRVDDSHPTVQPAAAPAVPKQPMHVSFMLDGKTLLRGVIDNIHDAAHAPASGLSGFDGLQLPQSLAGNIS